MKNRNSHSPILFVVLLALVASHPLRSQTTTVAPSVPSKPTPAPASAIMTPSSGVTIVSGTPAAPHTVPYTVVTGDSWTRLAEKFNTTRKKLKALNELAADKLAPGQVIQVPSTKSRKAIAAEKAKAHHAYLAAQPVQDFDIPASTFASCPVPVPPSDDDAEATAPGEKAAPVAKLVSPAEMAAADAQQERLSASAPAPRLSLPPAPKLAPVPKLAFAAPVATSPAPSGLANEPVKHQTSTGTKVSSNLSAPHLTSQGIGMNSSALNPSNDWGFRFLQQARALGDRGIEYDDDWRPPGERTAWTMDCSNTSRYLYKVTAGINLPRTASDQYYYLHLQGKAWDVPNGPTGWADVNYLRAHLKPGDLLFWENTYRPERQPPITHVMVFLGTNAQGQWIMAGSQGSRGGEHNRPNGGPDIYVFRPSQACGGYTSWFVRHTGRFCAFGRPLEADQSKFVLND